MTKHQEIASEQYEGPQHADALFEQILGEVDNLFVEGRYLFDLDGSQGDGRYWFANPAPIAEVVRRALLDFEPSLGRLPIRITTDRADM